MMAVSHMTTVIAIQQLTVVLCWKQILLFTSENGLVLGGLFIVKYELIK